MKDNLRNEIIQIQLTYDESHPVVNPILRPEYSLRRVERNLQLDSQRGPKNGRKDHKSACED